MNLATTKEFRLAVRACVGCCKGWTEKVSDETKRRVGFQVCAGTTAAEEKIVAKVSDYLLQRSLFVENLRITGDGMYLRGKVLFERAKAFTQ